MADAKFEVYNSSGTLQMSLGSRTCRMVTINDIGATTSGSVSVTGAATGTIVAGVINGTKGKQVPPVSVVGSTVSWNYGSIGAGDRDTNASLSIMLL